MWSGLAIVGGILLYAILMNVIKRVVANHDANLEKARVASRQVSETAESIKKSTQKARSTYAGLLKSIIRLTFIVVVVMTILAINGVDVGSLLAGIGILSVVIGLAVQDVLKDMIRGITIITEKYFQVGDIVTIGDYTGEVLSIGMLTTKMTDRSNGNAIVSISNRNIVNASAHPGYFMLNLTLPKEHSLAEIGKILTNAALLIEKDPKTKACAYLGVSEVADGGDLTHLFKITCNPKNLPEVKRAALKQLLVVLEDEKVPLPYDAIEVTQR